MNVNHLSSDICVIKCALTMMVEYMVLCKCCNFVAFTSFFLDLSEYGGDGENLFNDILKYNM